MNRNERKCVGRKTQKQTTPSKQKGKNEKERKNFFLKAWEKKKRNAQIVKFIQLFF